MILAGGVSAGFPESVGLELALEGCDRDLSQREDVNSGVTRILKKAPLSDYAAHHGTGVSGRGGQAGAHAHTRKGPSDCPLSLNSPGLRGLRAGTEAP